MIDGRAGRPGRDEPRECRGELVARERRGDLSNPDRIALDAHLEACASCRISLAIEADFAADSAVELDDAERIARLSSAARRWGQRRARPPVRASLRWIRRASPLRVLTLSAGALLIAGTASATAWWWRAAYRPLEPHADARAVIVTSSRPRAWPPARPRAFEPPPAVEPPESAPTSEPALDPVSDPSAAPHTAPTPDAHRTATRPHARNLALRSPRETAASLLRLAGEARGRGDTDVASSLYRRLQREFSDTREAALSSVPWGGILLRQGQAERALQQFDRYLATEPHGNLLPEALYGRGRALAAVVGRGDEEKKTWRRLLAESPGSAYESHARRRLDELK